MNSVALPTRTAPFDPYRAWLRISIADRPLNPYQLLGLKNFEDQTERIYRAVQQRRAQLADVQSTEHAELWNQVSQEVERAIATLGSRDELAILNASLRRRERAANFVAAGDIPAAAATTLIACGRCQEANPGQRRFCLKCGATLWDRCVQCQTVCAASETFCGGCGINLSTALGQRLKELDQELETAQQRLRECDYEVARGRLLPLATLEEPRFETRIAQAITLLEQIARDQQHRQTDATQAIVAARQLLAEHRHEHAVVLLGEIPERLRNDEFRQLLERAKGAHREVLSLSGEIREAIKSGQTLDLLPRLERLLTLKPDHAEARRLTDQVRELICASTRKRLQKGAYRDALELLGKVTGSAVNEEVEKLLDQAQELTWLQTDVATAPHVTQATLAIAERFAKAAPRNELAQQSVEKLRARIRERSSNVRHPLPVWSDRQGPTRIGPPVDWLLGCRRLVPPTDKNARPTWFVAAGLALQGLGKATCKLNMVDEPKTSRGLFGRLGLGRKKAEVNSAWGIDVGDSSLKAVRLTIDPETNVVSVADFFVQPHPQPLAADAGPEQRRTVIEQSLRGFLTGRDFQEQRVCVGLPGSRVFSKTLRLPGNVEEDKLVDLLEFEMKHHIPIPLAELAWSHEFLFAPPDAPHRPVLIAAARRFDARDFLGPFEELEIPVHVLQSDAIALHNFAAWEFFGEAPAVARPTPDELAVALLDVGATASNLVISSPHTCWSRSIRLGGDAFRQAIVQELKLTHEQAELVLREPWRASRMSRLARALDVPWQTLAAELKRSFASHAKDFPQVRIQGLFGVGGAFATHGLLRFLRTPEEK